MQKNILIVNENTDLINLLQADKNHSSFVISYSQISLPKVKCNLSLGCTNCGKLRRSGSCRCMHHFSP